MARIKYVARGCCKILQRQTTHVQKRERKRESEHARMYSSHEEVMGAVIAG